MYIRYRTSIYKRNEPRISENENRRQQKNVDNYPQLFVTNNKIQSEKRVQIIIDVRNIVLLIILLTFVC